MRHVNKTFQTLSAWKYCVRIHCMNLLYEDFGFGGGCLGRGWMIASSKILWDAVSDSKVHGANMGPIWGRQDPGGPHVGPMIFAIWGCFSLSEHCWGAGVWRRGSHVEQGDIISCKLYYWWTSYIVVSIDVFCNKSWVVPCYCCLILYFIIN